MDRAAPDLRRAVEGTAPERRALAGRAVPVAPPSRAPDRPITVTLGPEEAERWRVAIGKAAEALVEGRTEKNVGPHCSTCFWQPTCWFGGEVEHGF
jgi:hypothetical protein